jgi:hypothetical protein
MFVILPERSRYLGNVQIRWALATAPLISEKLKMVKSRLNCYTSYRTANTAFIDPAFMPKVPYLAYLAGTGPPRRCDNRRLAGYQLASANESLPTREDVIDLARVKSRAGSHRRGLLQL